MQESLYNHVFHKVLNLVPSLLVNDWVFFLLSYLMMMPSPVTDEPVYLWNVPNKPFLYQSAPV